MDSSEEEEKHLNQVDLEDLQDDEENQGNDIKLYSDRSKGGNVLLFLETLLYNWIHVSYEFGLYLSLSLAFPNYFILVPLLALIAKGSFIASGAIILRKVEDSPKFKLASIAMIVKSLFIIVSLVMAILIHFFFPGDINTGFIPYSSIEFIFIMIAIAISGSVVEIFNMVGTLVRKHWIIVLSHSEHNLIPGENGNLQTINRWTEIVVTTIGPIIIGVTKDFYKAEYVLIGVVAIIALFSILDLVLQYFILRTFPMLENAAIGPGYTSGERTDTNIARPQICSIVPLKTYYSQTIFLALFSYVILSLNPAIPNPIMINYLVYQPNVNMWEIGLFYGVGLNFGEIASFYTQALIDKVGVSKAGLVNIWLIFFSLCPIIIKFFVFTDLSIWVILIPIIVSRVPSFTIEKVQKHLTNAIESESEKFTVMILQFNLIILATLVTYIYPILTITPMYYNYILTGSLGIVGIACIMYTAWYFKNPVVPDRLEKDIAMQDIEM